MKNYIKAAAIITAINIALYPLIYLDYLQYCECHCINPDDMSLEERLALKAKSNNRLMEVADDEAII